MILREATIKYKGYDSKDLKPKSAKKVCCSCDGCGRVRWIPKQGYHDLCYNCAKKLQSQLPKPKFVKEEDRFISGTGIDRIETIKQFGYDPDTLSKMSGKRVISICQNCNKIREINFFQYRDLCRKCISIDTCKGLNNPMWGKFGKESGNWKGGIRPKRNHLLFESHCIKLNSRFNNSEFHHITRSIGVFIPKELHRHIGHNLKTGKNMGKINMLSLQFIRGWL